MPSPTIDQPSPPSDDAPSSAATNAVIESIVDGDVPPEEVVAAVNQILSDGVTSDQATALAANATVLDTIDAGQATEIFSAISVSDLSSGQEAALVAAVSEAPTSIKNAFESEIDVYGDGLDDYIPVGSAIDVGDRRTIIAATTVISTVASAAAAGSLRPGSGSTPLGPADRDSGRPSGGSDLALSNEAVAGRQSRNLMSRKTKRGTVGHRQLRAFRNGEASRMETLVRIIRVILKEISSLAFTLAGSVIVFVTLSGQTRRIALIATSIALAVHFTSAVLESRREPD